MEQKGGVDGVALGPAGAVEHHRGQQQEQAEGGGRLGAVVRAEETAQPEAAPGEHHIKEHGEEFNQVEIGHIQIGEGGEKIEVGDIVVPHAVLESGKAAVVPEIGRPGAQKVVVIVGAVIQTQNPVEKGCPHWQQAEQAQLPAAALQGQQGQRQGCQHEHQHKNQPPVWYSGIL